MVFSCKHRESRNLGVLTLWGKNRLCKRQLNADVCSVLSGAGVNQQFRFVDLWPFLAQPIAVPQNLNWSSTDWWKTNYLHFWMQSLGKHRHSDATTRCDTSLRVWVLVRKLTPYSDTLHGELYCATNTEHTCQRPFFPPLNVICKTSAITCLRLTRPLLNILCDLQRDEYRWIISFQ